MHVLNTWKEDYMYQCSFTMLKAQYLKPHCMTKLRSHNGLRFITFGRSTQRGSKSLSRTFSFTVPGRWNDLAPPPPPGMLDPCQSSCNNWKLISFNTTWLHHKKERKKKALFSISSSFSPSLASLYFLWTMPETWYYEHFLCLFASSRLIALCIPQL